MALNEPGDVEFKPERKGERSSQPTELRDEGFGQNRNQARPTELNENLVQRQTQDRTPVQVDVPVEAQDPRTTGLDESEPKPNRAA